VAGPAGAAKLVPAADGVLALSAFHDEPVVIPTILNLLGNSKQPWETTVAHLDVPPGKYVVVAKARVLNPYPNVNVELNPGVACYLVAGVDSDAGNATDWNMLALTVVHTFVGAGRIQLNCTRATVQTVMQLEAVKITAIRVDTLKNAHVAAG
jgi:Zn-dependent alcohol dehydrogenase